MDEALLQRSDAELLSGLGSDPRRLMALCRGNIGERILSAMAAADYGTDAGKHLRALEKLLVAEGPLGKLAWIPGEVLRLVRWSSPRRRQPEFGGIHLLNDPELHWARLLSCTLLLRAHEYDSNHDTLAVLVESAAALGPEIERACRELVVWRLIERVEDSEDFAPFLWFALADLSSRAGDVERPWFEEVLRRLEASEAELATLNASYRKGPKVWLLRTQPIYDHSHGLWQRFATQLWRARAPHVPPRLFELCAALQPGLTCET